MGVVPSDDLLQLVRRAARPGMDEAWARQMMAQDASWLQQAGGLQMKEVRSNGVEAFQQLQGADSRAQTQGDFRPLHANTSGGTVHPQPGFVGIYCRSRVADAWL